eukprot:Awhi_evm1s13849
MKGYLQNTLLITVCLSAQLLPQMVSGAPVSSTNSSSKLPTGHVDDPAAEGQNTAFLPEVIGGFVDQLVDKGTDVIFGENSKEGEAIDGFVDKFTDNTLGDTYDDVIEKGTDFVDGMMDKVLDNDEDDDVVTGSRTKPGCFRLKAHSWQGCSGNEDFEGTLKEVAAECTSRRHILLLSNVVLLMGTANLLEF